MVRRSSCTSLLSDILICIADNVNFLRAASRQQTEPSRRSGRESFYKALSPGGDPELATMIKVMRALAFGFTR